MPRRSVLRKALHIAALVVPCGLASWDASAARSTELVVGGAVATPAHYDLAGLSALPAVTQTVSFVAGTAPQTHTYTGASLWSVLSSAGITVNANKNDVLNRYVQATGSDGYRTVFSLGELNPSFGNRADLVAYSESTASGPAPLAGDGFARVTAPGDVKGGRYVSNLVDLDMRSSGSTVAGAGGGLSTAFAVSGAVDAAASFDLATLKSLPATTLTVGTNTYTGVSFWDFLNRDVGLALDSSVKNDVLNKYVVATGSDGYKSVFSLGELDAEFGNQPDLIAYDENGGSLGADGFARIVVPNDLRAGRWVSNLISLVVFTAAPVPEPAGWALMLAGLAVVGLARQRRRAAPGRRTAC